MHRWRMLARCVVAASLGSIPGYSQANVVVRNGHITSIGRNGSIKAPAGAIHVNLSGKTVMPAMNNVHVHVGNEGYVSWSVENPTPENVLHHLEREAFYGMARP
jgi:imidazolonepropionase-like amidohydrolase